MRKRATIGGILSLKFNSLYEFCRYIEKSSGANEIMPFGSKTEDFEWRMNIKAGDIIDVCDTSNVWYNSTVLKEAVEEVQPGHQIKEIFIGYRVYDENGDKVDTEGKKFNGWSSRYDEWLSVTNPRIQP